MLKCIFSIPAAQSLFNFISNIQKISISNVLSQTQNNFQLVKFVQIIVCVEGGSLLQVDENLCSACFTTCVSVQFPIVELGNTYQFTIACGLYQDNRHSSKQAGMFEVPFNIHQGLNCLDVPSSQTVFSLIYMLQLHPSFDSMDNKHYLTIGRNYISSKIYVRMQLYLNVTKEIVQYS